MTSISQQDILFDDISILKAIIGHKSVNTPTLNANCDCAGYTSTQDDDDFNTNQIAIATSEAN